jgi:hypothetical protein
MEDTEHAVQTEERDESEGDKKSYTEIARDGISAARDALMGASSQLSSSSSSGGKEAGKEKEKGGEEGWAPCLFYAYAKRVSFFPHHPQHLSHISLIDKCNRQTSPPLPATSSPSPPPAPVSNGGPSSNPNSVAHHRIHANQRSYSLLVVMICPVVRGRIRGLKG